MRCVRLSLHARPLRVPASRRSLGVCCACRRVDVLGAGFAGVAVTWHLLSEAAARGEALDVRVYDVAGVGGGASGVSTGLLNPLASRADTEKLLWRGVEGCAAAARLVAVAEEALGRRCASTSGSLHLLTKPPRKKERRDGGTDGPAPAQPSRLQKLTAAQAAELLPGFAPPADVLGVALYPAGMVVDAPAYLSGLWAACEALAVRGAGGTRLELLRHRVPSLSSLFAGGAGDVVVAAGAAVLTLPELTHLPLTTCGGATLRFTPRDSAADNDALPANAPALLVPGATYIAPTGDGDVVLGGTKARLRPHLSIARLTPQPQEFNVPPESSFNARRMLASDASAQRAVAELLPAAAAVLPCLSSSYSLRHASWGVRALSLRTPMGALPLVGRVPGRPRAWALVGLGARGLVYHALLAEALARSILDGDDSALPRECAIPGHDAKGLSLYKFS